MQKRLNKKIEKVTDLYGKQLSNKHIKWSKIVITKLSAILTIISPYIINVCMCLYVCVMLSYTHFLALPWPSMAMLHRSSTSLHSPSKSWGWGQELLRFLLPGDVCFSSSTSLNTTAVPPPAVGRHSPCKQRTKRQLQVTTRQEWSSEKLKWSRIKQLC